MCKQGCKIHEIFMKKVRGNKDDSNKKKKLKCY